MADVVAPSLGLGLGLTRIGCFLNGCCYGRPTEGPFGVHFPADSYVTRVFGDAALHPTQLYSALTGLAICAILLAYDRAARPEGRVFGLFLVLDAVGRFALDFFRSYEANVYVLRGLTVNQLISVGLFLIGVLVIVRRAPARPATVLAPAPESLGVSETR
jgi:phosphatidylglycerol:prolipoprotein diacylglycerol transferase